MGSIASSIFGFGQPEMPEPVQYPDAPERDPAEESAVRDAERKKNRARAGGVRSTLLSNPLGTSSAMASSNPGGLLGIS